MHCVGRNIMSNYAYISWECLFEGHIPAAEYSKINIGD